MKAFSIVLMVAGFVVLIADICITGSAKAAGIIAIILMGASNAVNMIRERQEKKKAEKTDEE